MSYPTSQLLKNFQLDGYSPNISLIEQSYLSVYVSNEATQPSDSLDGYEFEVLGLLDDGNINKPSNEDWFILLNSTTGASTHQVNGVPPIFDVSNCTKARVHLLTNNLTLTFNGYAKGGNQLSDVDHSTGTDTNDDADAGDIGEVIMASAAEDSVISWTTNTAQNICSISLTPGDWDVQGRISWGGATAGTYTAVAVSEVSANIGSDSTAEGRSIQPFLSQANSYLVMLTGLVRISLAVTTTIYLVGQIGFTGGTPTAGGTMRARRMR